MFYREKIATRVEDFDPEGRMYPYGILQMFENVANHHYILAEAGINDNLVWVVTEWRVEIIRHPSPLDEITAQTWAIADGSSLITRRGFSLLDANGDVLVMGQGSYILFDIETQKIARITPDRMTGYEAEDKFPFDEELKKHRISAEFDREIPIQIYKVDIDSNRHVHNTKYINYALEGYNKEPGEVKFFRITFKNQVKYGDKALLRIKTDGEDQNFTIIVDDKPCTYITIR